MTAPTGPAGPVGPRTTWRGGARPRPIGWMTVVIAVVLYLAGSNIGSGWVVLISAAMVGAVALDLVAVHRADRRGRLEPSLAAGPAGATTTRPVPLVVRVTRPALGTGLLLADPAEGTRAVLRGPAGVVELPVTLARGRHDRAAVVARTTGPLGLAQAHRHVEGPAAVRCRPGVLPAIARLRAVRGAAPADASPASSSPAAHGVDVRGVRGFAAGDPRRAVHWRATARQGRLMVRELDTPREASVRVAVDPGTWTSTALDLATTVVASLAEAARGDGVDVTVAVDGAVHPWGPGTHDLLAVLPPATGVPARPLRPADGPADGQAEGPAAVRCAPSPAAPDGVRVVVGTAASDLADAEEVRAWLAARV